jgi:class 3 adenylate cyclase/tetratricopeptide (TPR) repeat protein
VREQRKVVTVLFADVVGSTSLAAEADPEVVRAQMSRYFARVSAIAQEHGGTVEKFAGDAAMVVFGVPAAHDDDAERAVRAAIEIREAAGDLTLRIGVNTGEAVTAAREDRQNMVTGDTVNVAARLQQGADPGEIVVGALTERLTRAVIEYAPREPVVAKGKAAPLAAFRAVRPRTEVPSQVRGVPGLHAPLIGRDRELRLLVDTYRRVAAERRLHLFTLVGPPGVGKSRLVDEALAVIAGAGARLVRGRCLPYGHGITYWPLVEMVRQDTHIALGDERSAALAKLDRWLDEMLPADAERPAVRARLAVMMGLDQPSAVMPDTPAERVQREIGWAVRRYVQAVARAAPVVMVVDDLQWAEDPLLDILEQLADRLGDEPAMLVCVARPEFLETRPAWGAGKSNSSTISLTPLSNEDTGALISQLLEVEALPAALRTQIVERSAGTPLFCEELIKMLVDDGRLVRDGASWRAAEGLDRIPVPPSITAVVTARLDGLPEGDRAVLQAASVIGQRFTPAQVEALFAGADVEPFLASLRRKGLIAGDDRPESEMSFSHLLVRDAAYGSMTKAERASLHHRFGVALEREVADRERVIELLAHHAETAYSLSAEVGVERDVLAERASRALGTSLALAERALTRDDRSVVQRALRLAHAAEADLPDGGGAEAQARTALMEARLAVMAGEYAAAARSASSAAQLAESAGLERLLAESRLTEAWVWNWSGAGTLAEFQAVVQRAIDACARAGDREGLIEARFVGANVLWSLGKVGEYVELLRALAAEARAAGDRRRLAAILLQLMAGEDFRGNGDVTPPMEREAGEIIRELGLRELGLRLFFFQALPAWHAGDTVRAEQVLRQFLDAAVEAGAAQWTISGLRWLAELMISLARFEEAAAMMDRALEMSETTGERWSRAELFASRAMSALGLGEVDRAAGFAEQALASVRNEHDYSAIAKVQQAVGAVRSAQGRDAEAESALRQAYDAAYRTDFAVDRIESTIALARHLGSRGRTEEAVGLLAMARAQTASAGWRFYDAEMDRVGSALGVEA